MEERLGVGRKVGWIRSGLGHGTLDDRWFDG